MEEILRLFPEKIRFPLQVKLQNRWNRMQEIRFRLGQPIELNFDSHTEWLPSIYPDRRDSVYLLDQLSQFSLYRMEDELREGYITIEGGHRVGLSGKVNTSHGHVKAIQHIAFFNIRIAKQKKGAGMPLIPYLCEDYYLNTLMIGPPQTGKTTLIRDVARIIGTGWEKMNGQKVGVIDERSEIGGAKKGIPQHDIGARTDLMDACPKDEGMMMMIRSMSPDILIVDEIGRDSDVQALLEAINAGVIVICTIHGGSLENLQKRPSLQPLFDQNVFERYVLLDKHKRPGSIHQIYNQDGRNLQQKSGCVSDAVDWRASFHRDHNRNGI